MRFYEAGRIDAKGLLYITRKGTEHEQSCSQSPFHCLCGAMCCPFFGEPENYNGTLPHGVKNLVALELCRGTIYFQTFVDERTEFETKRVTQ